ncbi:MAG TPA: hypothetical protein VFR17_03840 [Mycobacterium sp.]|nr:hypothetical protein [Mycobacterium sp.]
MNTTNNRQRRCLRGIELRYVLTMQLFQHGTATIAELIEALAHHGFCVNGRASKAISDALRWERRYGRVYRRGRALYGPAQMPRATEYRIHQRVMALRDEADSLRGGRSGPNNPGAPPTG